MDEMTGEGNRKNDL